MSELKSLESQKGVKSPESNKGVKSPESKKRVKSPETKNGMKSPESKKGVKSQESNKGVKSPESKNMVKSSESKKEVKSPKSNKGVKSPESKNMVKSSESKKEVKSPESKNGVKSPSSNKAKRHGSGGRKCVFCEQSDVDEDSCGKLMSKSGTSAHYFCMLFSSGLSQNGKSEKQGILGFMQDDIMREVKRGFRLRCSYCRKVGATIGCVVRNCKKMFHLGCGRQNGTLHQFFDTFSSFCQAHRPQQDVPTTIDPSYVCSVCMTTVECKPSAETLRAPCCRNAWYHRSCMQSYAKSAGLYFFKCPLCNNKDEFQTEMLTYGIYIPDQDASWETEPHAFHELLERYQHCDAKTCKCAEGRKYDKEGSKWELLICDNCGSAGGHVGCHHLIKKGKDYICPECHEVDNKYLSPDKKLTPKRQSLEAQGVSNLSPAEKQAREAPGPSNRMRKTGLPCVISVSPDGRGVLTSPSQHSSSKSVEGLSKSSPKKRKMMSVAAEQDTVLKKKRLKSPDGKHQSSLKSFVSPSKGISSTANKSDEFHINENKKKRLSLEEFKDGTQSKTSKDSKKTQKRRQSHHLGTQKTLEGWLKLGTFKPKVPQNQTSDKTVSSKVKQKTPVKRPAIIEYRGEKLQIKSPRVVLKKNIDVSGKLKPRALDLNPKKKISEASTVVTTGKALLADLDNDFRVTRNMVSNVDCVRSPGINPKSAKSGSEVESKNKVSKKVDNKYTNLIRNMNEDLSEDELTPKSRDSLLRSTEKKKASLSRIDKRSCETQKYDQLIRNMNEDLSEDELTPKSRDSLLRSTEKKKASLSRIDKRSCETQTDENIASPSRELRSSGKKKLAISNFDSSIFGVISNENEPVTPTSSGSSDNFFPLKGLLDENANITPNAKSNLNKKQTKNTTPVNSKNRSEIKERGIVETSKISSPVLRSATLSTDVKEKCSNTLTPDRKVESTVTESGCKLSKVTRSLSDIYSHESVQEAKDHNHDSVLQILEEKENENLTCLSKGTISPLGTSESAKEDIVSLSMQLTPRRKTLDAATPPRIKRSTKSLSELKSYQKESNRLADKDEEKIRSELPLKTETNLINQYEIKTGHSSSKEAGVEENFSPGNMSNVPRVSKRGRGRPKRYVSLLSGEKMDLPSVKKCLPHVIKPQTGIVTEFNEEKQFLPGATSLNDGVSKIDKSLSGVDKQFENKIETPVSATTRQALVTQLSKNRSQKVSKSTCVVDEVDEVLDEKERKGDNNSRKTAVSRLKSTRRATEEKDENGHENRNFSEKQQNLKINAPIFDHDNKTLDGANAVSSDCIATSYTQAHEISSVKNVIAEIKPRSSPRLKKAKEPETLANSSNKTLEKFINVNENEENTLHNVDAICEKGPSKYTTKDSNKAHQQENDSSPAKKLDGHLKNVPQQELTHSDSEVIRKRKGKVNSPEKAKNVNDMDQLKESLKLLKNATDKLSENFVKSSLAVNSSCENTCPNPQPLSKKSRQGTTVADSVSLAMLASLVGNKDKNSNPELQGAKTVSQWMMSDSYYSSLMSVVSDNLGSISSDMFSPSSAASKQVNPSFKLKSLANLDNCKGIKAFAEQVKKYAENFHESSRSSSRSSEEYIPECPTGLSLSPSYVTRFRRSLSDSLEDKPGAAKTKNSKINGVRKDTPLLENLEGACSDVSSDKRAMSDYYASESNTEEDDLDLDDMRALTDIQT